MSKSEEAVQLLQNNAARQKNWEENMPNTPLVLEGSASKKKVVTAALRRENILTKSWRIVKRSDGERRVI